MSVLVESGGVAAGAPSAPSLWQRTVAVFARPGSAWVGLHERGQWWFPLLLGLIVTLAGYALTYERAQVPTIRQHMERQVESGEMPAEALERVERQLSSPVMKAFNVGSLVIVLPLLLAVTALLPWLAAGFMLGRPFSYRDAFNVTAWAGLVRIPAEVLVYVLAWVNQTMTGIHIGFGVLLPAGDPPSKLMNGLGVFLDYGIGPFYVWYLAVLILGTAALSGAPRRSVAWTLSGLYLVFVILFAALAAMFTPGA